MAAIIDFPKEAAFWRRRSPVRPVSDREICGKILIFCGVRYSRKQAARRKPGALKAAKEPGS